MTHEETVDAVRRSLLADDGRETHHGIYPKRPEPLPVESPFSVPFGVEDSEFPGCFW